MKTKQVVRWGRSRAVRIVKEEAKALRRKRNTPLKMAVVDGKLVAETGPQPHMRHYTLAELVEGLTPETPHADMDDSLHYPIGQEEW